jgi:hypothetical protein
MSLEGTLTDLVAKLTRLEQALDNVLWAVVQGQPKSRWGHALADYYEAIGHDLMAMVKETKEDAEAGQAAAGGQLDLLATRRALARCQECYNRLLACFYRDPFSSARRSELRGLARKGDEWASFVRGVDDALDQCPEPLHAVGAALLGCWEDLVDRAGLLSVSAQATYIGPQIYLGDGNVDRERTKT